MEKLKFENVPSLLADILEEIRRISSSMVVKSEPVKQTETKAEESSEPGLTHEDLRDLCLKLNRENNVCRDKIKSVIARFTDGRLQDVPVDKLSDLKAEIEAECDG
jgi:hypothetical protein